METETGMNEIDGIDYLNVILGIFIESLKTCCLPG